MDNQKIWDDNWKKLAEYSKKSAGNRWAQYLIRKILKHVELEQGVVLDIGCGVGVKSEVLASCFPNNKVVGIDFSSKGIENAQKMHSDVKNLTFLCMDARDYVKTYEENVEMISAFSVLEHIEDWESFLHEMCNLSHKYILVSVPTGRMREYEKKVGHYRNYKRGQLESFLKEEGYDVVDVFYAGFPFWSPLSRDYLNIINRNTKKEEDDLSMNVSYNKLFNSLAYVSYRYLSFSRIGDEFYGLFRRCNS